METFCTYIPSKGESLFKELRKQYDYPIARKVFLRAIHPQFIQDYRNTLTLDSEGVPTLESLMNNSNIKEFIGLEGRRNGLEKLNPPLQDTRENYNKLLQDAYSFNKNNPQRDDFVAIVEYKDEGEIGLSFVNKTPESVQQFSEQYGAMRLNERIAEILEPIGITINDLTQAEVNAGRVGVTDFSKARGVATSTANIIRVANNMEGDRHISEEFSHLLIGAYLNEPLIQRAIKSLQDHPEIMQAILGEEHYNETLQFYDNDMSLVAEEVLGHILQDNLLSLTKDTLTPAKSLFDRLYNSLINKFKNINVSEVENIINEVDSAMSTLGKDILSGAKQLTREDIANAQREVRLNALSDRINRNIEILKSNIDTELKKYKIAPANKIAHEVKIMELQGYMDPSKDTTLGILNYAKSALSQLKNLEAQFSAINTMQPKQLFGFLRAVRMHIQSYSSFIDQMHDAIIDEESEADNMFTKEYDINGERITVKDIIEQLDSMSKSLTRRFSKTAIPAFTEFLKPFIGEEFTIPFGRKAGTKVTIDALVKEAQSDISFFDRWMQSMGDSADILLQGFDSVVKEANDATRLESIDFINKVHIFREKCESMGIRDFDWMFETDDEGNKSGNYISAINYAQFQKELKEMLDNLDNKYGKNPSGVQAQQKIAEKQQWLANHALSIYGTPQPNPLVYPNNEFKNLTVNQRAILDEFLKLKEECDKNYPPNRIDTLKAIQIRKTGAERFWESVSSPSTLFENVKESIKNTFLDSEDDNQIFGEKNRRGLTDFTGAEFLTLPILYTNRLKNPNEITTDVIGSLMAYGYASIQYKHLDEIVDALEIGKSIVTDFRQTKETRGSKKVIEKIRALGMENQKDTLKNRTQIEAKLQDFLESHVYHRYLKDEGTFNLLGNEINKGKFVSAVLRGSSLAQMGFNWLANVANVLTGTGMQNIEAAAGQFFNIKELASADKSYFAELAQMTAEANNRNKTTKVGLVFDLFNVKQNFEDKTQRLQTRNWLKRICGSHIAFLGQELGDHWLYGRTAIAMLKRKQVLLNGQQMSLWDALQVQDVQGSNKIKELNYRDIKELDGSDLDISKMRRQIDHVNQKCFGIYNDEDSNAANRVAMGRLLQQYRKWMTVQYSARFRQEHYNAATESWEEGYYRTMWIFIKELTRGKFQIAATWNQMSEAEQQNVKRALFELIQVFAVWALANWIEWPDDKNRPWAVKMAEYSAKRLAHELGGLSPAFIMPQKEGGIGVEFTLPNELLKTVKSPIPATSVLQNGINLIQSAVDPHDWIDEIQSGPYKGMSTFEKNLIKSPLPIAAQYKQIDKFTGDLDNSIQYYVRTY
jgi:hypothetical protein